MVQNTLSPVQAAACSGARGIKLGRGAGAVQGTLGMDSALVGLEKSHEK